MAGFEITWNVGAARRKRQAESASLAKELMEDGRLTPQEINRTVAKYLKTGDFELPTSRSQGRMFNAEEIKANPELEGRSTLETSPISFKKKKALIGYDDAGKISDLSGLIEDADSVSTVRLGSDEDGYHVILDASGKEVRREPNGKKFNTYGTLPAGGGKPFQTPEQELAEDTVKKYQAAKQKGEPLSEEFIESARTAFKTLGIPFKEQEKDPTLFDKGRNVVSKATGGAVSPAAKKYTDPVADFAGGSDAEYARDVAAAKRAIAVKKVTKEEADRRLSKKWGRRHSK